MPFLPSFSWSFWGFCVSFDDPTDADQIASAKKLIGETSNGFVNFKISKTEGKMDSNKTFLPLHFVQKQPIRVSDYSLRDLSMSNVDNCVVFTVSSENCFLKHDKNELEDESNANYISGKEVERIGTM